MANTIIIRSSPVTINGPEDIYDLIASTVSVTNRTATSFTLVTGSAGVTIAVTGTGFVYNVDGPTGGSYSKSVILDSGVPIIEYNYSPAISIAAVNSGIEAYVASGGTDTAALDALYSAQPTTFTGGAAADTLFGLDGVDIFNGGGGIDLLNGRGGNDTYNLGADNDTVQDSAGTDTITSTISRGLTGHTTIENLTLLGTASINGAGNALANILTGNSGNNILDGKTGTDRLVGGLGNDTYVTDGGETIVEAADAGTDTVRSTVSHALGANIENLVLIGTAAINGAGNALNNILTGNTAANTLNGGTGTDTMAGGGGNDTYGTDGGDTIIEATNEGVDTVRSTVSHSLALNVENLVLIGAAAVNGAGNTLANSLTGNSANNILDGKIGNDVLNGGLGNDTLTGGVGGDTFVFNTAPNATTNRDTITDFSAADDTIQLENAIYTKLTSTGTLDAAFFRIGAAAADTNDFVVYNSTTGALIYDSNGSAAGGLVQIATLATGLALTSADFLIV